MFTEQLFPICASFAGIFASDSPNNSSWRSHHFYLYFIDEETEQ